MDSSPDAAAPEKLDVQQQRLRDAVARFAARSAGVDSPKLEDLFRECDPQSRAALLRIVEEAGLRLSEPPRHGELTQLLDEVADPSLAMRQHGEPGDELLADAVTRDAAQAPTAGKSLGLTINESLLLTADDGAGRFSVLRPLTAGGMGEISVALDRQVRREVAFKRLLGNAHENPAKRDRFLLEGQITGGLEHPGIAPVYALGVDSCGRPYYAMRLVRGQSMRQRIREFHASSAAPTQWTRSNVEFLNLLRRLADVCLTVAYAHSRGVLHRDLKPENVMLGRYGETYVVDWGMARVVGARVDPDVKISEEILRPSTDSAASATRYGSAMGTPGFMSPEQAGGRLDELTAATDVYSLGAMLYCLLTNEAPIAATSMSEFLQRVEAGIFPPPTEVNPRIPKALAAASMKALAVKPADRYASARDLAADLERWLADEPVLAASETRLERLGRFVRRNYRWLAPLGAAAALVAIVALVAAVAINRSRRAAEVAAVAEQQAKLRSDAHYRRARETIDAWIASGDALRFVPSAGVQNLRTRMLEAAAKEYEQFVAEENDDPSLRLEQGRTLVRLASLQRLLGQPTQSQQRLDQAIAVLKELTPSSELGDDATASLAAARRLAANLKGDLGEVDEAEAEFSAAIAELSPRCERDESSLEPVAQLAALWTDRGGVLAKAGRIEDASAAFSAATSAAERLAGLAPSDVTRRLPLATAQLGAAQIKLLQGDAKFAAATLAQAAAVFDAAQQLDPYDPAGARLSVTAYANLAAARRRLGDAAGEQDAYRQALAAAEAGARLAPESPSSRVDVAMMKTDYGQSLAEQFQPAVAEQPLQEAVQSLTATVSEFPQQPAFREALAAALCNWAQAVASQGRYDDATLGFDRARVELEGLIAAFANVPPYLERLAIVESAAAQTKALNGESGAAKQGFERASELFQKLAEEASAPLDQAHVAAIHFARLGDFLTVADSPDAADAYRRAAENWEQILSLSSDPQVRQEAAWFFALCPQEEIRNVKRSRALLRQSEGAPASNSRRQLIEAVVAALAADRQAAEAAVKVADRPDFGLGPALDFVRAVAFQDQGQADSARDAWRRAEDWRRERLPGEWDLQSLSRVVAAQLEIDPAEQPTTPSSN